MLFCSKTDLKKEKLLSSITQLYIMVKVEITLSNNANIIDGKKKRGLELLRAHSCKILFYQNINTISYLLLIFSI